MGQDQPSLRGGTYQIEVLGKLDPRWSHWFDGLEIVLEVRGDGLPITTLRGPVADQAALRGILNKVWDLNLTLISVTPITTVTEG